MSLPVLGDLPRSPRDQRELAGANGGRWHAPTKGLRRKEFKRRAEVSQHLATAIGELVALMTRSSRHCDLKLVRSDCKLSPENVQRAPLHPLDQFRAFLALREKGQSEEDIAAAFFVSVAVMRQRLRLAAVSPKPRRVVRSNAVSGRFTGVPQDPSGGVSTSGAQECLPRTLIDLSRCGLD